MSKKRSAIVTPVFNRVAELLALFESLSHQDRQEITWHTASSRCRENIPFTAIETLMTESPLI